jgi:hypothetical protein
MPRRDLIIAVGAVRYRIERPWGDVPLDAGIPSGRLEKPLAAVRNDLIR